MTLPAARLTDKHTCPMVEPGPKPHLGGPIMGPGVTTVLIGNLPAAVMGDQAACAGVPDAITGGATTVLIGNSPAARMGDPTAHGGTIVQGLSTVLIGDSGAAAPGQRAVFRAAAGSGRSFCELCQGDSDGSAPGQGESEP